MKPNFPYPTTPKFQIHSNPNPHTKKVHYTIKFQFTKSNGKIREKNEIFIQQLLF